MHRYGSLININPSAPTNMHVCMYAYEFRLAYPATAMCAYVIRGHGHVRELYRLTREL